MIENRTVRTTAQRPARPTDARRPGFTLIELLVVMFIILLVSAVTLPSIISAISHRQVSEAARVLQAALVGARDSAIHNNAISGIRLLPDPTINGINTNASSPLYGMLDPSLPLAMNRIVPLEAAPDYDEGKISIIKDLVSPPGFAPAYPYPSVPNPLTPALSMSVLMVEECPVDTTNPNTFTPNEPTSWFWNIRIGDKIRISNAGQYYTVIGPMTQANPDLFVNDAPVGSPPGTPTQLVRTYTNPNNTSQTVTAHVEYLFLVNGQDDDNDGFVDNGWDGVDNDQDGNIDIVPNVPTSYNEWTESEKWLGSLASGLQQNSIVTGLPVGTPVLLNQSYTITRRPAPSSGSRELALPPTASGVGTSQVINPNSGSVDILVNPDGTVVPSTVYSSPSSFGLNGAFLHFWLAERSDVAAPDPIRVANKTLP